jgi:DNA recombination protein RmuC
MEALRSRVLLATPATLVALLRTVAVYWQQREIGQRADEIAAVARELYERGAAFGAHLEKVGAGLRQAVTAYDRAVGSYGGRFVPMARRLEEMSVTDGARRLVTSPAAVDALPRELT